MRKALRSTLTILISFTTVLAPMRFAQANIVDAIKASKAGITAVVEKSSRNGKLGTMVKYYDRSGRVKYQMFWGKQDISDFSPDKVSKELRLVRELEKGVDESPTTGLPLFDRADQVDLALKNERTMEALQDYLVSKNILIPPPKITPDMSLDEVLKAKEAFAAAIKKELPHVHHSMFKGKRPNVFVESFKKFPMDAASFFIAIGAMTTFDLLTNYNDNPVAYDQFLDGQKDPVGMLSFYAFMVANGVTNRAIQDLLGDKRNKQFRHFLPYFGMSMGMTASNMVHEIYHFPHLKDCAKALVTGKDVPSDSHSTVSNTLLQNAAYQKVDIGGKDSTPQSCSQAFEY
ncbi:MAG: hypothetical protein V4736_08470, partial [Bdellovibrionota bacterium]